MQTHTENSVSGSYPKVIWTNLIFFIVTGLVTLIGAPLYIMKYGISGFEIGLTLFYMIATGMSITGGYHRLFSHASYQANKAVEFFYLFFGAAAFEQPALDWSAQHRDHHRYVDTDMDPYSIKKGFFYAHIGWLIFWRHKVNYETAKDLQKNSLLMNQFKYYHLWAVFSGIVLPVIIGALAGHALGAFIFAVCARIVIVHHATFCINSVCHIFGKATYDIYSSAKDHWFVALLTYGEGYHNFHHRFPSDYRNGVRWYQWDPTKWFIALLAKFGATSKLKKISRFRIMEAKLAAENQKMCDWIAAHRERNVSAIESFYVKLNERYRLLRQLLVNWEAAWREHHSEDVRVVSKTMTARAIESLKEAQQKFQSERESWLAFIRTRINFAARV